MSHSLAIDLGTCSVKALLTTADGQILSQAGWCQMAAILSAGLALRWLRDQGLDGPELGQL